MYQAGALGAPDDVSGHHRPGAGPHGVRSCATVVLTIVAAAVGASHSTDSYRGNRGPDRLGAGSGAQRYGARVPPGDLPPPGDRSTAIESLVAAALDGDQAAWQQIVDRHAGLVWSVVRGFRLGEAEASDVAQTVWLRLVENLPRVHQPAALPGWLATTARRESIRAMRRTQREVPTDAAMDEEGVAPDEDSPEWNLLADERQRAVWRAMSTLGRRCQLLLRALAYDAGTSYAEISTALDMPVGSIGPTRSRCLQQLRRALETDAAGAGLEGGSNR